MGDSLASRGEGLENGSCTINKKTLSYPPSIFSTFSRHSSRQILVPDLKGQYFGHLIQTDSVEKTLMLGNIEEKGMTEDEMAGWHHRIYGHEFE